MSPDTREALLLIVDALEHVYEMMRRTQRAMNVPGPDCDYVMMALIQRLAVLKDMLNNTGPPL